MLFFENVWAKSVDFEFLRENFPKLAKIFRLFSKFMRITLKMQKCY